MQQVKAKIKRWLSLKGYGLFTSTFFGATTSPIRMRQRFEKFGSVSRKSIQKKYPKVSFEDHSIEKTSITMEAVCAKESYEIVILYLHGGAFFMGSADSYRNRAMRVSFRLNAKVYVPNYRLAPEHPYPAAFNDVIVSWEYVKKIHPNSSILVAGDSAGGGLCLSLILKLKNTDHTIPDGALMISPWTDLSVTGKSVDENRKKDLWFTRKHLEMWANHYTHKDSFLDPYVSPVFGDYKNSPPLLILVGENELLLDDSIRIYEAAKKAGSEVYLHKGKNMQHDWPLTLPWLEESKKAWKRMSEFTVKFHRDNLEK